MTHYNEISPLIKNVSDAIVNWINRDFKKYNLTMQQMKVLTFLKEREGVKETNQKDIQEHMYLSHSTVVSILKGMEAKGFIQTTVSKNDKRKKVVTLTGQEEAFVTELMHKKKQVEDCLLKGFSNEERQELRYLLEKIFENIQEVEHETSH